MHKAWFSIQVVPYYFSGSSIQFQGHTGWKYEDLSNWSKITRPVAAIKFLIFALLGTKPFYKYVIIHSKIKDLSMM